MFRATRVVFSALKPLKTSTGLVGLDVHPTPLPALKSLYSSTLSSLSLLPPTSVYRQATEALTQHRLAIVEKAGEDIEAAESQFGKIIELVVEEAKAEQGVVAKMQEWKAWEELEEKPAPGQWRYFEPTSDV